MSRYINSKNKGKLSYWQYIKKKRATSKTNAIKHLEERAEAGGLFVLLPHLLVSLQL